MSVKTDITEEKKLEQAKSNFLNSISHELRTPLVAMLGYAYDRSVWGMGYATEAALAMLELAFDVLGVRRVWASCDSVNTGSARVLEKVGMRLEGTLRHDMNIRGDLRDSAVWGILEREWRTRTRDEGSSP